MRSFVLYELFGEGAFEGRKREGDANQEKGDKRMKNGGKKRRQEFWGLKFNFAIFPTMNNPNQV